MTGSPDQIVPPNPAYGSGMYRRRILLSSRVRAVSCLLEDNCHAFRVIVHHNDVLITDIQAQTLRAPVDICFDAGEAIKATIGQAITSDRQSLRQACDPAQHCTHLYDLVVLAIRHAHQQASECQYDIEVDDEREGLLEARCLVDGVMLHHWRVRDNLITTPAALEGFAVNRGTGSWTAKHFHGKRHEAALMLLRGLMVAGARRWDLSSQDGVPSTEFGPGLGVCYTYSQDRVHLGRRVANSIRDFSDTPEQLLTFK